MATWKPEDEPVYDWKRPAPEERSRYKGEWIAYDHEGKIRGHGRTPDEVVGAVEQEGLTRDDVTFGFVPRGPLVGCMA